MLSLDERLGTDLTRWASGSRDVPQLLRWCGGEDFPQVGYDEGPVAWLIRGLIATDHTLQVRQALVEAVADALDRWPSSSDTKTLWNLLELAAFLGNPEKLFEPLRRLFLERRVTGRNPAGFPLTEMLRSALMENQLDRSLRQLWLDMVAGRPDPYLRGNIYDGYRAIRSLPPELGNRSEAPVYEIGFILRILADRYDLLPDRRAQFKRDLADALESFPSESFQLDLFLEADSQRWPIWAVECARMYFPGETTIVWHYLLACIPQSYLFEVVGRLCDGNAIELKLPPDTARLVARLAPRFEEARRDHPFRTVESMHRVVTETAADLYEQELIDGLAGAELAALKTLASAKAAPNLDEIIDSFIRLEGTLAGDGDGPERFTRIAAAATGAYPTHLIELCDRAKEETFAPWAMEALEKLTLASNANEASQMIFD